MRITFVLPAPAMRPSGGFRIVYEYANRLAARGHAVTVLHAAYLPPEKEADRAYRRWTRYLVRRASGRWRPDRWVAIDPRVDLRLVPDIANRTMPSADVVVASSWITAERVLALHARSGRKYYLVQGIETWAGQSLRVEDTWRAPMTRVAVSRWIQQTLAEAGVDSLYVPNAIDGAQFRCESPVEARARNVVGLLWHPLPLKGSRDALAALAEVHRRYPGLRVQMFGVPAPPAGLPSWVDYHRDPSQAELRALYNRCAMFVAPSHGEGWGLTASEAMACGAALVATDSGGHREFARHGVNALLCPPRDVDAMAAAVLRLLEDDGLRLRLAAAGIEHIRRFTWDASVACLESILAAGISAGTTRAVSG